MKSSLVQPSLSRDFAILTGVILFVLLLLSLWVTWSTHAEQSQDIINQLEKEATRIDRTLEREIFNASYLLDAIGHQIQRMDDPSNRNIAKILQAYQSHNRVYAIWAWTDDTQSVVVSSNRGILDEPVNIADRDYIQKSLADPWQFVIGTPIEGRVSNRWILPVSLGVTDDTGRFLGSITASLDIQEITEEINDLVKRPGISFAILNKNLMKLTEVSDMPNFVEQYFPEMSSNAVNFKQKPSGVLSYANLFSDENIYAFYKVSNRFPYILLVGYNVQDSQEAIRHQLLPRLLQIFSIAAFALLFLWIVRVRIIRPVESLTTLTSEITHGVTRDFQRRKAPMEIDALASEISNLSDYIEERKRVEGELRDKLEDALKKQQPKPVAPQKFTEE